MGPEQMTSLILEKLRQPSGSKPCQLTLSDGRKILVKLAGIECFGEIRSVEVIEPATGQKSLIPYRDIIGMQPN